MLVKVQSLCIQYSIGETGTEIQKKSTCTIWLIESWSGKMIPLLCCACLVLGRLGGMRVHCKSHGISWHIWRTIVSTRKKLTATGKYKVCYKCIIWDHIGGGECTGLGNGRGTEYKSNKFFLEQIGVETRIDWSQDIIDVYLDPPCMRVCVCLRAKTVLTRVCHHPPIIHSTIFRKYLANSKLANTSFPFRTE